MKVQPFNRICQVTLVGLLSLVMMPLMAQPSIGRAEALKADPAASPVRAELVQKLVQSDAEGRERLVDAAQVKPGDRLQYELTYTNRTAGPVRGLQATLPIPEGTTYLPDSALPPPAQASLDGKTFAVPPLKRTVQKDGRNVEEIAPPQSYRALRWTLGDLASGAALTVKARVEVNSAR